MTAAQQRQFEIRSEKDRQEEEENAKIPILPEFQIGDFVKFRSFWNSSLDSGSKPIYLAGIVKSKRWVEKSYIYYEPYVEGGFRVDVDRPQYIYKVCSPWSLSKQGAKLSRYANRTKCAKVEGWNLVEPAQMSILDLDLNSLDEPAQCCFCCWL